jgi:formylglycine-generating enzyme required for sulfatase activity
MHGNVWSFCLDWSADKLTGGEDPKGAEEGEKRALRGGSWIGSAPNCVSTYRGTAAPSRNAYTYGFRVVKALP